MATTRLPGRENDSMTSAAAAVVTGPPQGWPGGAQSGAGSPAQTLSGTPGPAGRPARGPGASTGRSPALPGREGGVMAAGPACRIFR